MKLELEFNDGEICDMFVSHAPIETYYSDHFQFPINREKRTDGKTAQSCQDTPPVKILVGSILWCNTLLDAKFLCAILCEKGNIACVGWDTRDHPSEGESFIVLTDLTDDWAHGITDMVLCRYTNEIMERENER